MNKSKIGEKRKATVNEQLGVDVLRHESLQELVEKGLYSSDEKMPDQQNRMLSLVTYKKVAERARAMADQMPAGEERDVVLSVYNDARDTVWQGTLKYVEVARVNDLQTYGYTMRSDGPNQMRANENLLRAGVITQEEFDRQLEGHSEKVDEE